MKAIRRFLNCSCLGLFCVLAAFAATGCRTVPLTGRSQLLLVSEQQESQMGLTAWQEVVKKEKPSSDAAKIAAVRRVGQAIEAVADRADFEWEFQTFASEQANAFCLPGGKVAVYEGLFKFVASDAELAAVVGHEIGHAIARHGGERVSQSILMETGKAGLSVALSSQSEAARNAWLAAYTGVGTVGIMLPYSRKHEYEADQIGLVLMAKAGYDPHAAMSFWQKFGAQGKQSGLEEFLSTHPLGQKRLLRLETMMPDAVAEYERAPTRRGLGTTY